jgi:hypothetical protein
MGSKKERNRTASAPTPPAPSVKSPPWAIIAVVAVVIAGGGVYLATSSPGVGSSDVAAEQTSTTPPAATTDSPAPATTPASSTTAEPAATAPQAALPDDLPMPPLPYVPGAAAGPAELIRQAYVFAAQNPQVLDYVPCYCGCGQTDGHVGNTDCFVERRAPNGAVEAWDTHGMT